MLRQTLSKFTAGLTQVLDDGDFAYLYGNGRIAQSGANGMEYFLGDALGSVRQLVDAGGEVVLAQSYTPYGEVLATEGEATTSYAFTGEALDAYTGLVYLRARWYGPAWGRFLSRDVWRGNRRQPMSLNPWLYVMANPINDYDPSGYYSQRQIKQILGVNSYAEVLQMFESGALAGQWGFLEVLHYAADANELSIYKLSLRQCQPEPDYVPGPMYTLPNLRVDGLDYIVLREKTGELYLYNNNTLLLVDNLRWGRNVLWYVPEASYYKLKSMSEIPFGVWANRKVAMPRLVSDELEEGFAGDAVDVLGFIITRGKLKQLEKALKAMGFVLDVEQIWSPMKGIIQDELQGEDADPEDISRFLDATRDFGYEYTEDQLKAPIPLYEFLSLIKNLVGAIKVVP